MRRHLTRAALMSQALLLALTTLTAAAAAAATPREDKPKAEDVIAKHLASIGSAEDLAAVKSIVAVGAARVTASELRGSGRFASQGDKVLMALFFDSTHFPFETAGYDGQSVTVARMPDGRRSPLGGFLTTRHAPFSQGLIGGVLSTAWPLRETGPGAPRLSYAGTDEVEGRKAHKLRYDPRRSGGLRITLFFDTETFRHVRTEYKLSIAPRSDPSAEPSFSRQGDSDSRRYGVILDFPKPVVVYDKPKPTAVKESGGRHTLVEDFSDFKPQGRLTLPHAYRLGYHLKGRGGAHRVEWSVAFSQFTFGEQIDDKAFSFVASK